MRLIIAAPANGTILKNGLKAQLEQDRRITALLDLSDLNQSYPTLAAAAAQQVALGRADRAILVCGTGLGTAMAANKVKGVRAATGHDLITVRGAVENYDAQILCLGQNVIAVPAAWALVSIWLDLRHDPAGDYGPKLAEMEQLEEKNFK